MVFPYDIKGTFLEKETKITSQTHNQRLTLYGIGNSSNAVILLDWYGTIFWKEISWIFVFDLLVQAYFWSLEQNWPFKFKIQKKKWNPYQFYDSNKNSMI